MAMFLVILSVFALAYLPFNALVSIIVALTSVLVSAFVLKDDNTTKKALQPTILLGTILSFNMVFNFIIYILERCGMYSDRYYASDFYDFISGFSNTISLISIVLTIVFVILTIVVFIAKADLPIVGRLAEKIVEEKSLIKTKSKKSQQDNESNKED